MSYKSFFLKWQQMQKKSFYYGPRPIQSIGINIRVFVCLWFWPRSAFPSPPPPPPNTNHFYPQFYSKKKGSLGLFGIGAFKNRFVRLSLHTSVCPYPLV